MEPHAATSLDRILASVLLTSFVQVSCHNFVCSQNKTWAVSFNHCCKDIFTTMKVQAAVPVIFLNIWKNYSDAHWGTKFELWNPRNVSYDLPQWNFKKCTLVAKDTRCVPGVCRIAWDYFQLLYNKTVCMTFKAKRAKSAASPVLKLGGLYVKSVDQCKYLGILLDTELSDDKDIQRQLQYQYCAANKLRASFSRFSNAVKNAIFVPTVRPCMHLISGVISRSHACRDCGWHIILVAELHTTCPGEGVLVATKFNVTFLPFRLCYVNTSTCFSKDAENLTTYGYVLWCSQIVCTRHYSLNTIIAFYSVIEWSNFAVSVWSMSCQATTLSHFT